MKDHKGQVCYIATQHPMTETVRDFWQMVWDQRVQTVVMVNDEEKEKPVRLIFPHKEPKSGSQFVMSVSTGVFRVQHSVPYQMAIFTI